MSPKKTFADRERDLKRRITELEAKLVGTETALRLETQTHHELQRGIQALRDELKGKDDLVKNLQDDKIRFLRKAAEDATQRAQEMLSDAELIAVAAEVQAELTSTPVSHARQTLQKALRARRVLPPPEEK